uniref:Uncharacterized protein n=1 Tax=Arundo donax TaxID=35708 RepID=A0A0A8Y379_ARUDO
MFSSFLTGLQLEYQSSQQAGHRHWALPLLVPVIDLARLPAQPTRALLTAMPLAPPPSRPAQW